MLSISEALGPVPSTEKELDFNDACRQSRLGVLAMPGMCDWPVVRENAHST